MAWKIEVTAEAKCDLKTVFAHLYKSHRELGHDHRPAFRMAMSRIEQAQAAIKALAKAPFQSTLDQTSGVRHVTKDRAIPYFKCDEATQIVSLLAVFYGGQDHQARMLLRRLGQGPS